MTFPALTLTSVLWPLSGGLLIGLSASLYLVLNGRIAGISGVAAAASGLSQGSSRSLSILFLLGLLAGSFLALGWVRPQTIQFFGSPATLIVAGLLTGFGTRLGAGCTSGHGVCGLSRLSPRSIVATATFMAVAALTVFILRHVAGGLL